jgi:glutamate racemase
MLVVACNTASSIATDTLKERFDVPILEVISPAVKMAVTDPKRRRVGVIGTRATVNSGVYEDKIKAVRPDMKVYGHPCPLLVPLVEEGWLKKGETRMIVKKYLHPLKVKQIDTPLLKKIIQAKAGKRVKVIDSSEALSDSVMDFLSHNSDFDDGLKKSATCQFYVSDVTEQFQKIAKTILGTTLSLEHVEL